MSKAYKILWLLPALACLPLLFPELFPEVPLRSRGALVVGELLVGLIPLLALACAWPLFPEPSFPKRFGSLLLFLLAAFLLTDIHITFVDQADFFNQGGQNLHLQFELHRKIIALSPDILPHSYRFLADGLIRVLESVCGSFVFAKKHISFDC